MNPLELADRLRDDYRRFTWTTYPVADPGLKSRLERLTDEDSLLWRGPYLSVQPRFQLDETLDELVGRIGLPPELVRAFPQVDRLFTHQVRAIERIAAGGDTLVATGTGSGKTESFLVPVVAHAYRTRHRPGVKAIALYPMNALVNDQEDRVRIACEALGLRYGVYTGATPQHKRDDMQENPPDILLTNYSMLEFILTRREDRKLFGAGVLRHLVLDEIHTYQGALGTEIACLVRRLRGHVDSEEGLVCVGLSATVSAGGDHDADLRRTATFASALFAAPLDVDGIVEETPVPAPIADSTRIAPHRTQQRCGPPWPTVGTRNGCVPCWATHKTAPWWTCCERSWPSRVPWRSSKPCSVHCRSVPVSLSRICGMRWPAGCCWAPVPTLRQDRRYWRPRSTSSCVVCRG